MLVDLPALPILFYKIVWTPDFNQEKTRSEYTRRTQTIGQPGTEQWTATAYAMAPATMAEMWAWDAFIAACRGSENTFNLPALPRPQTSAANPVVTAAVAGNRAVTVDDASDVQLGMFATVLQADGHARLVKVVGKIGLAVHFEPGLSGDPTVGEELIIDRPYGRVSLPNASQPLTIIGEPFQLEAEEKL